LDILERQILTLLPELRETYGRERVQDLALMGSLEVHMVIEPNGGVSDLRFPVKRVSNDRLTSAVFNQMRAWTFPPSELPVQLRFTLLFVPSGIDEASIVSWEKRLGNRPVMENFDEASPPEVAAAAEGAMGTASQEQREEPSAKSHAKAPTPEKKPVVTPESQPKQKKETAPSEITGWYRVLYPTALRTAPQRSAKVIAQLRGGTRVRVVNVVNGQWLEVRSVSDRPPGFLWWEDAVPERSEKVGRK
jgi:hypothetical protein